VTWAVRDAQAAETVKPGDGALDDPAEDAEAGAVGLAWFGDHGSDAALPEQATVLVVVVAAVGKQCIGASTWSSHEAGNGGNLVDQGQELGDNAVSHRLVPLDVGEAVQRRPVGYSFGDDQVVALVQGGREKQLGALLKFAEGDLEEAELVQIERLELVEVLGLRHAHRRPAVVTGRSCGRVVNSGV
jgi:hypothetical protein